MTFSYKYFSIDGTSHRASISSIMHIKSTIREHINNNPGITEILVYEYFNADNIFYHWKRNEGVIMDTLDTFPSIGVCPVCGEKIYEGDDKYRVHNSDQWIHQDCFFRSSNYVLCGSCGEVYLPESNNDFTINSRHGFHLDSDCFNRMMNEGRIERCEDCGEWFLSDFLAVHHFENGNVRRICDDCAPYGHYRCCECGEYFPRSEGIFDEEDGDFYCSSCGESINLQKLREYSFTPVLNFLGEKKEDVYGTDRQMYFGVELETDRSADDIPYNRSNYVTALSRIDPHLKLFSLTRDSSLRDGVEITTQPASLAYHLHEYPWKEVTEAATVNGFRSHNTKTSDGLPGSCGLHIHVSRNSFGESSSEKELVEAKIVLLMDRHWDNIVRFSRRKYFHYCKKPNSFINKEDTSSQVVEKAKNANGHYKAVNFTSFGTLEFRVFRGTLNVDTIKATIQFTSNMVNYAKTHSILECLDSEFEDISQYEMIPELETYLKKVHLYKEEEAAA